MLLQGIYKVSKLGKSPEKFLRDRLCGDVVQTIVWAISNEANCSCHEVRRRLDAREWIETTTARYCACDEAGMPLAYGWGDASEEKVLQEDWETESRRQLASFSNEPPPGSWAATAGAMASLPQDPNEPPMDWDAWKDEMKEGDLLF